MKFGGEAPKFHENNKLILDFLKIWSSHLVATHSRTSGSLVLTHSEGFATSHFLSFYKNHGLILKNPSDF